MVVSLIDEVVLETTKRFIVIVAIRVVMVTKRVVLLMQLLLEGSKFRGVVLTVIVLLKMDKILESGALDCPIKICIISRMILDATLAIIEQWAVFFVENILVLIL